MSAPDTNVEKQAKRHKGPLKGMPGAIILAVVAIIAVFVWVNLTGVDEAPVPEAGTATQTQ
jgi:hypothetical protein